MVLKRPIVFGNSRPQELDLVDRLPNTNPNYIQAPDGESGLGLWATYADAAGTIPVDGTDGSPVSTFLTNSTSPISGVADFVFTKDANNRQGEGFSQSFTLSEADRFKQIEFSFDYKVNSVNYQPDDLQIYLFDITNNLLSGVSGKELSVIGGRYSIVFPLSGNSLNYRVIVHVASVNALDYSIDFNNFRLAPAEIRTGPIVTDWQQYTASFNNFGAVTSPLIWYRRVGSDAEFMGTWTNGTPQAGAAGINMPPGMTASSTYTARRVCGDFAGGGFAGSFGVAPAVIAGSSTIEFVGGLLSGSNTMVPLNANAFTATSGLCSFRATIRIEGWSSNGFVADSKTFKISGYSVNAGRVSGSDPTVLGQWRSRRRLANTNTYTDTSASPATIYQPNPLNGFLMYAGLGWAANDNTTSPTRYDIQVGRNKNIQWEFYSGTGRTGLVSVDDRLSGTLHIGCRTSYDPTTGIASITQQASSAATSQVAGLAPDLAAVTNVYFDIVVSDNPIPMLLQGLRSEIVLRAGSGFGSSNVQVRNYSVLDRRSGNDLAHTFSATNGTSIDILSDGLYTIRGTDFATGTAGMCITRNSTTVNSATFDGFLGYQGMPANSTGSFQVADLYCRAGDKIRVCSDVPGSIQSSNAGARLSIAKTGY